MTSTSESDVLLKVENLYLGFQRDLMEAWTWRDLFTGFLSRKEKKYEQEIIFVANGLNFTLRKGERLGLVGVNGAGKTSLCRCISGMYKPTQGRVFVKGEMKAFFNTHVGIQPELTGRENAQLLAQFLYPTLENIDEVIEEAIVFSELGDFADAPYRTYSNGMQTRLWLSLISSRPTDLLILDEVFDGADTFFRKQIEDRILRMIHGSGGAIFVSHSKDQILKVCTRVIVMEYGEITFDGDPSEGMAYYEESNQE